MLSSVSRFADLIDLKLQAKQAHWNVKDSTFIVLHHLFDSVREDTEEFVDTVAERIVVLGGIAGGTIIHVCQLNQLPAYPVDMSSGGDHVEALSTALATCSKVVRMAINSGTELGNVDTADLFTAIS